MRAKNEVKKKNSEFKPAVLHFKKLTLCHIVPVVEKLDEYIL